VVISCRFGTSVVTVGPPKYWAKSMYLDIPALYTAFYVLLVLLLAAQVVVKGYT
jgi:hypothetical protein